MPYINPQLPPPGTAISVTAVNGKKAEVDGQSLSLIAQLTPDDALTINGTHLDARFKDFNIASLFQLPIGPGGSLVYLTPGATAATYDFSNTPIGTTPEWAGSATYDHTFHVFGGELNAQVALQYTGKRMFGMFNQISRADTNTFAAAQLESYTLADVSLRYAPDAGKWSVMGYVRNLTDKEYATQSVYNSNAALLAVSDPRVTYAYVNRTYGPPRTYGVILSFNY